MIHRNLKFIFGPHAIISTEPRYTIDKLQRWATYIIGLKSASTILLGKQMYGQIYYSVGITCFNLCSCTAWPEYLPHYSTTISTIFYGRRERSRRFNTNFHHQNNSHAMKKRMAMRKSATACTYIPISAFDCVWQPISVGEVQDFITLFEWFFCYLPNPIVIPWPCENRLIMAQT